MHLHNLSTNLAQVGAFAAGWAAALAAAGFIKYASDSIVSIRLTLEGLTHA